MADVAQQLKDFERRIKEHERKDAEARGAMAVVTKKLKDMGINNRKEAEAELSRLVVDVEAKDTEADKMAMELDTLLRGME